MRHPPQGNSTANGTIITVWSCTGSDLQKWHWEGNLLVHDVSGKCMTPQGNASGKQEPRTLSGLLRVGCGRDGTRP
ncbi:ricin-type beta-trefoil lectin domain protein [Streptomyces sp. NPDC059352]|uniref:ricin-type beta-trefoil lectin domain protein n=1 Tax=Streptomyces sp. NPDC059352 TaxID=3346810 RepID=UPI003679746A